MHHGFSSLLPRYVPSPRLGVFFAASKSVRDFEKCTGQVGANTTEMATFHLAYPGARGMLIYRKLSHEAEAIAALVCGFPRENRLNRGLFMLQAFIDDSMEGGQVLVMGGFVANSARWETFSDEWQKLLTHARLPAFHMKEIWARRKNKELWEHCAWFYGTIRDHVQGAVTFTVPIDALNRVVQKTGLTTLRNPYLWAIKGVINGVAQYQPVSWSHIVGQLGSAVKVYSGSRSCCQNRVYHILLLLLSLWGCG